MKIAKFVINFFPQKNYGVWKTDFVLNFDVGMNQAWRTCYIIVLRHFSLYFCKQRYNYYHKIKYNFTEKSTNLQRKIQIYSKVAFLRFYNSCITLQWNPKRDLQFYFFMIFSITLTPSFNAIHCSTIERFRQLFPWKEGLPSVYVGHPPNHLKLFFFCQKNICNNFEWKARSFSDWIKFVLLVKRDSFWLKRQWVMFSEWKSS